MDVRAEMSYPTASLDEVFALVVDKDFRTAVCVATGALEHRVDVDHRADGRARVRVERTLPADVPDVVKSFVAKTITIVQTETWELPRPDGVRVADLHIAFAGQPVAMRGSQLIERAGAGSRQVISGVLTVSVPFLGKRIEPEVAKAILAAAAKEQQTAGAWLARAG